MDRFTAAVDVVIATAIWPSIEQIVLTAVIVIVSYGVEKLVKWIKAKIDKKLSV